MSIGFLLSSPSDAVIWRGPKKNGKQDARFVCKIFYYFLLVILIPFIILICKFLLYLYMYAGMIRQFLSEVDWGRLDYLILDTPPGTSDEHLSATSYLKDTGITGAIIVTTPPQVALLDVRKEIDFCRKVNIPILGVIENMTIFVCPKCKVKIRIQMSKKEFIFITNRISLYYAEYC